MRRITAVTSSLPVVALPLAVRPCVTSLYATTRSYEPGAKCTFNANDLSFLFGRDSIGANIKSLNISVVLKVS